MTDERALEAARQAVALAYEKRDMKAIADQVREGKFTDTVAFDGALAAINQFIAMGEEPPHATHRHIMRGTEYTLIGIGKIQSAHWTEPNAYPNPGAVDMREVAIYSSVDDGTLWVRPVDEFNDGRFEPLPAAPQFKGGE